MFVALRGERADGHDYIEDALARGASVVVAERSAAIAAERSAAVVAERSAAVTLSPSKGESKSSHREAAPATFVTVPDTRLAASALADAFYDHPSRTLTVVGVTGTNGKTTTTHLVRDVLETAGIPCGVIGTLGGEFREHRWKLANTTPLALELHGLLAAQRDAGAQAVAMEVSSHALALHRVDHVAFDVAALTNVTRDHLDFHGTIERYAAAKRRLFDLAPIATINEDDAWGARFLRELGERHEDAAPYYIDGEAHGGFRATNVRLSGDGSTFRVGNIDFAINLPGRFNVSNALAALGCASLLGVPVDAIRRGLASTRAVPGRMERFGAFGIEAIVDYAHTPDALENVLRAARETTKRDLIVVFGCGGDRDAGKREQMGEIAARLADRVIVTSDNPRSEDPDLIIAQILAGAGAGVEHFVDRREAIERAIATAEPGDVVVIAGKGHEQGQEFADGRKVPFDDVTVARELLAGAPLR
jgi:UDP-N-acetylmuramoyl-L-alanyl-D-glutamate--2,6-diaminopimelate ligase